jgi:diguanylate cyclase (GGDEF)-like protein
MGVRIQLYLRRQDGLRRWVDLSSVLVNARARESLWLAADITPLRESQALATHIELHDPLTALPNRALLTDRLRAALQNCRRHADALAVCHLDIDDFTRINERLGIAAGDQLLREVARRLGRTVREGDTVSRIHGNAFILLLTGVDQGTSVRSALDRVVQVLGAPVALQGANGAGEEILLTATIGVALFPDGGTDAESLFDSADRAMYLGKQEGRNRIRMLQ